MCFYFEKPADTEQQNNFRFVTPDCPDLARTCAARRKAWQQGAAEAHPGRSSCETTGGAAAG